MCVNFSEVGRNCAAVKDLPETAARYDLCWNYLLIQGFIQRILTLGKSRMWSTFSLHLKQSDAA
jgi:hypothetical protein